MYTLELYQGGDRVKPTIKRNVGTWRDNAREQFASCRERFKRSALGTEYMLVLRDPEGNVELSYTPEGEE